MQNLSSHVQQSVSLLSSVKTSVDKGRESVWWGAHSAAAVDLRSARGLDAEGLDNDAGECKHGDTAVLDLSLASVEHVGVAAHAEGVEAEVADSGSVERLLWGTEV